MCVAHLKFADGEDVGGLVHVQIVRGLADELPAHEPDVPIAQRERGLDEQRVRRVERLVIHAPGDRRCPQRRWTQRAVIGR